MNREQHRILHGWRRGGRLLMAAIAIVAAPVFAVAEPDPSELLGPWMAESKKIAIEIYPCVGLKLRRPRWSTGHFIGFNVYTTGSSPSLSSR